MRANLKNLRGLAALGMTLLATAAPTWAGRVSTDSVRIGSNQISRWASGSMGGARYSADNKQSIQCIAVASTNPVNNSSLCSAADSAGNYLVCGSKDPKLQEVVQGMTDSSYIYFVTDSSGSVCTNIVTYHGSDLLK